LDRNVLSLVEYNMSTGDQHPLMANPLGFNPSQFTWDPTMTRGLFSVTSGICAGIGAMTRQSVVDLALSIEVAGQAHLVQEHLHALGAADCSTEIRADLPAWSPDGLHVAFLASPQSLGQSGFSRTDAPWNIYLVGPSEQQPILTLGGLVDPLALAWSPDSQWLAFSGDVSNRGNGLWIYGVGTHELRRLTAGTFLSLAWSPNGSQIAAVHDLGVVSTALFNTELRVFDLKGFVSSAR